MGTDYESGLKHTLIRVKRKPIQHFTCSHLDLINAIDQITATPHILVTCRCILGHHDNHTIFKNLT